VLTNGAAEHICELLSSTAVLVCDFQDGFCPLDLAVEHNHCEVARLLLKYGADPNSRNEKAVALFLAAKARGELPAQRGAHAPLLRAVARGYAEITKALLDAGADPEMYDEVSDRDCAYSAKSLVTPRSVCNGRSVMCPIGARKQSHRARRFSRPCGNCATADRARCQLNV
jgi:ankyrin repeat protein